MSLRKSFKASLMQGLSFFGLALLATSCATDGHKSLTKNERARLLVDAASGAIAEGDPTGALQLLVQAEKEDAKIPELYHTRSLAFFYKHDLNQAIRDSRKAIEIKPDYSEAQNTLGKFLLDAGQSKEAEKHLKIAAADPLYRETFKAHTNLGILYYRGGDYHGALSELDKAILEEPNSACVAYYYRGHLELKEGRFPDAVKDYASATRRFCAGFADAHFALGIAYERGKQYDLAKKKFLDIRQAFPNTKVADQAVERLKYLP